MIENIGLMKNSVVALKKERAKLVDRLNKIKGVHAFDSKAYFVLFTTTKPAAEVYDVALSQGLVIKKLGKLLNYENCLRTTVGLPWMNDKIVEALTKYMET